MNDTHHDKVTSRGSDVATDGYISNKVKQELDSLKLLVDKLRVAADQGDKNEKKKIDRLYLKLFMNTHCEKQSDVDFFCYIMDFLENRHPLNPVDRVRRERKQGQNRE